ncbi:MBL fold metallo-hydrolase [Methanobacterium alcaliphilum]|uniref:MBL fold metallo-hydrolase n=1 Tax=Methanobacterium alcaliphilum TaxID=392018 RepID=UPI00200AA80E|nr:MBL fold metallo-hydrolase [Methanobacterium alcaliphilum]MCK9151418.1 MBL fold metallo-hydrolase [Methanobacterium alcaliphilum]
MDRINDVVFIEGLGYDSNVYLIGNVIVDTGAGSNPDYLFSEIKKAGINPEDISKIVNTHCHYDHVGGNFLFDADISIHHLDAPALENADQTTSVSYMFGKSLEPMTISNKLKEGDKIAGFEVIHTPGHTRGGICLFDGEILISGDTVFANGGFGRVDIGGNIQDMTNSLERLNKLNAEFLLPGHGPWVNNANQHIKWAHEMIKGF